MSWNVLECTIVKAKYDRDTDTLKLILREGVAVSESDEDKPGMILDYDKDGNVVGIELLNASQRVENPRTVEGRGGLSTDSHDLAALRLAYEGIE